MVTKEDILNIFHVRNHYFVVTRRITGYLSKKIYIRGFFQLASSSPQQQKKQLRKLRSAMNHFQRCKALYRELLRLDSHIMEIFYLHSHM